MQIVFGDFETYYERGAFSLSKMPTQAYIADPRFEVIGYAQKINDQPTVWESENPARLLEAVDWNNAVFVAHNARFDAMILRYHYNITPRMLIDTMSLARATGIAFTCGASLAALAKEMQNMGLPVPDKGTEVSLAAGKHREDFTAQELAAYGAYAVKDVDICAMLFNTLKNKVPAAELAYQHHVLEASVCPRIQFDRDILSHEKERLQNLRNELLDTASGLLGITPQEVMTQVRSKDKFRFILEAFGGAVSKTAWDTGYFLQRDGSRAASYEEYLAALPTPHRFEIPTKLSEAQSATAGRQVYILATASTDWAFKDLSESEDEEVAFLCSLKLGLSSTIQETRVERFKFMSALGGIGVPINISGAHTHRQSGADKLNVQNLPSGRKKGQTNALKRAVKPAGGGHVLVGADASQIEARLNAYISGQTDLLEVFATGGDPYSYMAGHIYSRDPAVISQGNKDGDKECKAQRQLGKAAVLGCGYRMGWARFQQTCLTQGIHIDEAMARHTVNAYRSANQRIARMWSELDHIMNLMATHHPTSGYFGGHGALFYFDSAHQEGSVRTPGFRLPDNLWVTYPHLKYESKFSKIYGEERPQLTCQRKRGFRADYVNLHGGVVLENITQALAFAVGKEHMRKMSAHYPFVMNEHDAWIFSVPRDEAEHAVSLLKNIMSTPPQWLPDCPLDCEAGWGVSLGEIDKG